MIQTSKRYCAEHWKFAHTIKQTKYLGKPKSESTTQGISWQLHFNYISYPICWHCHQNQGGSEKYTRKISVPIQPREKSQNDQLIWLRKKKFVHSFSCDFEFGGNFHETEKEINSINSELWISKLYNCTVLPRCLKTPTIDISSFGVLNQWKEIPVFTRIKRNRTPSKALASSIALNFLEISIEADANIRSYLISCVT